MKPISTLMSPLDYSTAADQHLSRFRYCAAPRRRSAESVVAFEVAEATPGEIWHSLREIKRNYENLLEQMKNY